MRKLTKLVMAMAVPVAVLAGGNANAGEMITDWKYENLFGFSAFAPAGAPPAGVAGSAANGFTNFTIGSLDANPTSGDPTKLTWGTAAGTPSGQSSLTLFGNNGVGRTSGTVVTNGAFVFDVGLTHQNFPILGTTLKSATLLGSLMLEATAPAAYAGLPVGPLTGHFAIVFNETPNVLGAGGPGHCLDSVGDDNPCPDIFVIDPLASSDLTNVYLGNIDGFNYFLDVDISGLLGVGPQACASVGQAAGCLGFVTPEGKVTSLSLAFDIRAIPEPGSLALLGLGLAGLGFGRIRRRK